jgi:hypothetical protein
LAVAQANPTVQANWQTYWSSWNQQSPEVLNNGYIPILWISDFQYGTVNSVPTSWSYTNPNLEYAINEMVLTDRFTLSLTSQGQYSPPVSTTLFLDPSTASWSLGSQSSYFGSADLGSISSFNDNDVRLTINDKKLAVNYDGTVDFPAYHFPNTDGTADQVLKTDGSGNLTWTTISSGTSLPSDSTGWLHNNGSGTLAWTTPGYIAPTSRNTNGNPYTISLGDMGALLMAIGAVNSITIPLAATVSLTDAFEMTIATTGPATSMDFVLASGVNVYYSGTNTIFTSGISVPAGKPAIIKLIYTGANEYWIIDGPGLTGT